MNDENTNDDNTQGEEGNTTESLFDKTNAATARQEAANAKTEELLNRQEENYAKQKLGGNSNAGKEPEKPVEDTPEEYAKKVMAGEIGDDKG